MNNNTRNPLPRPMAIRRAAKLRRLGMIVALSAVFFGTVIAFCAGRLDKFDELIASRVYDSTAHLGLRINDVALNGREFTSREDVLAALNVHDGDPTLAFDPAAARTALEALPRIASAEVERRLPGTIIVNLTERAPIAIWQHGGKMMLIDHDGVVLGSHDLTLYGNLPMVVGEGAAKSASNILEWVSTEPALAKRVTAYIRVGDRRWDLRLDNNIEIKLPEADAETAIHTVAAAEAKSGLLERDVVAVDLRLPGKLVVETSQPRDPKRKTPQQQGI
jgi:cell division protein FtsQ